MCFQLPLGGMVVYHRVSPSINFTVTHLYTLVETGTVRVKCLAQEYNTMFSTSAQTPTTQISGDEHSKVNATTPPTETQQCFEEKKHPIFRSLWKTFVTVKSYITVKALDCISSEKDKSTAATFCYLQCNLSRFKESLTGCSWQNCNIQGKVNYEFNFRNTWKLVLRLPTSLDQVCT